MAWIKIYQTLINHPKLFKLAELLNKDIHYTCGILVFLWCWALDYADDGDLSKYSENQIYNALREKKENTPNILKSLIEAGFLDDNMKIHNWLDYAGEFLRGRYKQKQATPKPLRSNSGVTPPKSRVEKSIVDNIRQDNKRNLLPKKTETDLQKIVNHYLEKQHNKVFADLPKEIVADAYKTGCRAAKQILELLGGDLKRALKAIDFVADWAYKTGNSWSLAGAVVSAVREPQKFKTGNGGNVPPREGDLSAPQPGKFEKAGY
jgi:hypothetical protein